MREIKFRVWIIDREEMIYAQPLISGAAITNLDLLLRLDGIVCWAPQKGAIAQLKNEYVLMQYTGLKDKNGKEIYEGDILSEKGYDIYHHQSIETRYKVMWGSYDNNEEYEDNVSGHGVFLIEYSFFRSNLLKRTEETIQNPLNAGFYEIIGNIYENPELFKEIES